MRYFLIMGAASLALSSQAIAQDSGVEDVILLAEKPILVGDVVYAKGVRLRTYNQPEVIDVLSSISPEGLTLAHPAERLNSIAGVNIHRGSGQEHLTAIRSPVLTGGAGAGSFLYTLDGVPLRAAGFANVNACLKRQLNSRLQ